MTDPSQPSPRGLRRAARGAGRGVKASARGVARGSSYVWGRARGAARAHGAGESGLFRLIELHVFNAGGDASVAIALAGTIFFAQPGEARDQVALFLGLTMLPFAIVAPLIGPLLDRFGHGRRWAIGLTFAIRGLMCIVMGDAIASGNQALLFPAALLTLVSSKAYGVTRAAAVPRLLPPDLPLMKANSRISLAGVVGGGVIGPIAAGLATVGPQ
ncbi:MAG TPA: MFS transporter, partial [Marmoricola sp.]|nr:MFS transporter [Marmoricola sp.]